MAALAAGRPTAARLKVLAFMATLALVLYLDRICISVAVVPIQKEFGLNNTQVSYFLMAFMLAYGIFEVPTGWLGDRYGSRGVLVRIVLWWSAFTALTGVALGLWSLVAIRFMFGVGEAGAYPNTARVLSKWFPARERGKAQGFVLTSALLGGMIGPTIAAYLIQGLGDRPWLASLGVTLGPETIKHLTDGIGWRGAFFVFGLLGVVWAAVFYWWFRDDPARHPAVNAAELHLIADGRPLDAPDEGHPAIPWGLVLRNPSVWSLAIVQTCGAFGAYVYYSWFTAYLEKARGVAPVTAGWLTSLVLTGGAVGCLAGGVFSDLVVKRNLDRRWSRRAYGFVVMALAAVLLVASTQVESPLATAAIVSLSFFCALSQQSTGWAVAGEISGRHLGALFGLMNGVAVIGGMGSMFFFGWFADHRAAQGYTGRAQWDPAFWVEAAVLFLGGCAFLLMDPTRSAVEEDH
jgi:MFS family permease